MPIPTHFIIKGITKLTLLEDEPPIDGESPWYDWEITFESFDEKLYPISNYVSKVTLILHETFPDPVRKFLHPPFKVAERGWGEFDLEAQFVFVSGERLKIRHPLLFEPEYQERFYETKVSLEPILLKLKQMPLIYDESFLRDFSDRMCALSDKEMSSILDLLQQFAKVSNHNEKTDLFYLQTTDLGNGSQNATLKFNINSLTEPQIKRICDLIQYDGPILLKHAQDHEVELDE